MKSFVKLLLVMLSFYPLTAQNFGSDLNSDLEENTYEYQNVLKISPVLFGASTFQLNYERYFNNRKTSLMVSPALLLEEDGDESLLGYKLMLQYRFYLMHLRKNRNQTLGTHNIGLYSSIYTQGLSADQTFWASYYDSDKGEYLNDYFDKSVDSVEGGVTLGIQIDIWKRVVLDFFIGGGIRYANVEDTFQDFVIEEYYNGYGVLDREYTGVIPKGGLQLGITF